MYATVVVGTDGSDTASLAVREASRLAGSGGTVHVVTAQEPGSPSQLRRETADVPAELRWRAEPGQAMTEILDGATAAVVEAGAEAEVHACDGDPAAAIIDVAERVGADVIVVGNKGMTGARRFLLGSVPNKVSHHAPCTVMIVRTT